METIAGACQEQDLPLELGTVPEGKLELTSSVFVVVPFVVVPRRDVDPQLDLTSRLASGTLTWV